MINQEPSLVKVIPNHLYQRLKLYQQQQGHASVIEALTDVLQTYFDSLAAKSTQSESASGQIQDLEKRLMSLTREVLILRQELPNNYDRLREQVATVRLSHSGLIQDLRDRLEAIEALIARQTRPPHFSERDTQSLADQERVCDYSFVERDDRATVRETDLETGDLRA
ncbi:MAG: hypothetical protein KME35_08130 [Aphanocapsa sp. GSE-SYN-MK-11-07L]|jgi:chromosome segregation ATPase|nr:hypothetical protein [Aphanocapsa sp. GSE-SYN-MK-11-07L]